MAKNKLVIFAIFSVLTIAFFWQFFFKGLYPFPGNFLLAWHEPYRSDHFVNNTILLPHKPILDDIFKQYYPFRTLSIDMMKKFQLPLWNPYNGSGMPLLATINTGLLDPFNVLFFIFPYSLAWSAYIIIQFFMIGFFTYLYCKKISLSNEASIFAGFVFSLSGFAVVRIIMLAYGLAIASIPLMFYIIESYLRNPKKKIIFSLPFIIFTLIVSSQPQISLYILSFMSLYTVARIITLRLTKSLGFKHCLLPFLLTAIGIGLSGIQILPTLELLKQVNIDKNASIFIIDKFLVPVQHLLTIVIPNYFGNESTYNFWGYGDYVQTVAYVGAVPTFFVYFAFISGNRNGIGLKLFYLIITVTTILMAISWPGSKFITSLPVPILSTGAPSRIFLLTTFCIAILSAYGFDHWKNYKNNLFSFILKTLPFILLFAAIPIATFILMRNDYPCRYGIINYCRIVSFRNTMLESVVFGASIIPLIAYFIFKNSIPKKASIYVILILISVIGIYNGNKTVEFTPKDSFFPKNALSQALFEKTRQGRVFGIDQATLPTNFATQFRAYDPDYYHPLYIQRYRELVEYANNGIYMPNLPRGDVQISNNINPSPELEKRRQRLFEILSVSFIIMKKAQLPETVNKSDIIWENNIFDLIKNNALPRTYAVYDYVVEKDSQKILERLFDDKLNLNESVVLEQAPKLIKNNIKLTSSIAISKYNENNLEINTDTNKDSLLVLTDNYYPGWKAFIDGKEAQIYRANYTFRAISLPEGKHDITFKYEPKSLSNGLILSCLSILILGALYLAINRRGNNH